MGRYQLAVAFDRKRGRPKKYFPHHLKDFTFKLIKIGTDRRRAGNPLSRVLRYLMENKKVKQILGVNLAIFLLVSGTATPTISAFSNRQENEVTTLNPAVTEITTKNSVRMPLDSFNISQGYHAFHRAIDLREKNGSPIYPIMEGIVKEVAYSRFSYGNSVIVDHGSGFESLYAHMDKIVVKKGEAVDQNTVLGTVGSTGFSTGSHLHLEVYDHGEPFNPLTILK